MSLEYLTPEAMEGKTKEELVQLLIRAQQKHKQLAFQLQEVKVSHVELVRFSSGVHVISLVFLVGDLSRLFSTSPPSPSLPARCAG